MKQLPFGVDDGVWRLACAVDPERKAILMVAGDRLGTSSARFYKTLITKAGTLFAEHLDAMKKRSKK